MRHRFEVVAGARWCDIANMKRIINLSLAVAGAWLCGCASDRNGMLLDTVGPAPSQSLAANSTNGTLLVYSAYEVNADFNARDRYRHEYSDYWLFSADGNSRQRVHNNSGTILQRAQRVALPAGTYRVTARANGYGWVTVPVLLRAGRETVLHLEGGVNWPAQAGFNQTNTVRLPDGEIVGWKGAATRG